LQLPLRGLGFNNDKVSRGFRQARPMKWKGRHTLALLLAIAGTAFYFYFVHRTLDRKELNGWKLRFSYQRFHCRVCLGAVEELSYQGTEVSIPNWTWTSNQFGTPMVIISTPVGDFRAWKETKHWRLAHGVLGKEDSPNEISPSELSQGWYDAIPDDRSNYNPIFGPFQFKKNMPAHWCLVANNLRARWIDPLKITSVDW